MAFLRYAIKFLDKFSSIIKKRNCASRQNNELIKVLKYEDIKTRDIFSLEFSLEQYKYNIEKEIIVMRFK